MVSEQSGRLPFTIAKARGDYAADVLYESDMPVPQITYSEGLDLDYRHFDSQNIEVHPIPSPRDTRRRR